MKNLFYLSLLVAAILVVAGAFAPARPSSVAAAPITPAVARGEAAPLEGHLNPDGSLNLAAGFEGSLDPSGWEMVTGADGAPRFRRVPLATGDERWDSRFGYPGVSAPVQAAAVAGDGDLYVGGEFEYAGGLKVNGIARWDGSRWHALGAGVTSNGYQGRVYAIAVEGDTVYVGGQFDRAGDVSVQGIARWDESTGRWSALGSSGVEDAYGSAGVVHAIALSGGQVFIGGNFARTGGITATSVAHWDGTKWNTLGEGLHHNYGQLGSVYALALDGSNLYAGGAFQLSGATTVNNIARWDSASKEWVALGGEPGTDGTVNALAVMNGDLYAAGAFSYAGGSRAKNIARWNGASWSSLKTGINSTAGNAYVNELAVSGGALYAGGNFSLAGGGAVSNLARWDGSAWSDAGDGIGPLHTLAFAGATLYAGGSFTEVGDTWAYYIARREPAGWSAVGTGGILSTSQYDPARLGVIAVDGADVYVGGRFSRVGAVPANNIARWNSQTGQWSALGAGLDGYNVWVTAIAARGDDLFVGGLFDTAGDDTTRGIARWNKQTGAWYEMGGVSGGEYNYVAAIVPYGAELYVGGDFGQIGGVEASNMARWDGQQWHPLGSGTSGLVDDIVIGGGALYAGGRFAWAGEGPAANVARWDFAAQQWSPVGAGFDREVVDLALAPSGTLYAAGYFANSGEQAIPRLAQWNGVTWSPVGGGLPAQSPYVNALDIDTAGNLYVGGQFEASGAMTMTSVAKWDGVGWSALGSGIRSSGYGGPYAGNVQALVVAGDEVYAGGEFAYAGDHLSVGFALWHGGEGAGEPTATPGPRPTTTPEVTSTPTATATPRPTRTPGPSPTPCSACTIHLFLPLIAR